MEVKGGKASSWDYMQKIKNNVKPEVGSCAAIIVVQACGATISLAIALAPQLFLNGCTDACAASILAILSASASQLRL